MKRIFLLFALLLGSAPAQAGHYFIEAAGPIQGSGFSPQGVFIAPFKDARFGKEIYAGQADWENIVVDAAGKTSLAKAWSGLKQGDLSYLWLRQLAYQLDDMGFDISVAAEPMDDSAALAAAKGACQPLVMEGEIQKLFINKRGADTLIGTNISGTNYNFKSQAQLQLKEAGSGKLVFSKQFIYEHSFYNKTMLGAEDRNTFPEYFATGLIAAARSVGEDPQLRTAVGLPTCTPTPTATMTPEIKAPKPGAAIVVVATPTPALTPSGPYWVNPNTGMRMNPDWKFDPEDGTPRSKFILHTPSK